jgi:hypothetical protein
MLIVKMHPVPGTSQTLRVPSFDSTLRRAIDKPSPSLPLSSLSCAKGRNNFSASQGSRKSAAVILDIDKDAIGDCVSA